MLKAINSYLLFICLASIKLSLRLLIEPSTKEDWWRAKHLFCWQRH